MYLTIRYIVSQLIILGNAVKTNRFFTHGDIGIVLNLGGDLKEKIIQSFKEIEGLCFFPTTLCLVVSTLTN